MANRDSRPVFKPLYERFPEDERPLRMELSRLGSSAREAALTDFLPEGLTLEDVVALRAKLSSVDEESDG